jgi:hypothetical protein
MTIYTGATPGPSAGPAGEHLLIQAIRRLGYMTSPLSIEAHLSQHALNLTYETGAVLPWLPDQFVYGRVPA